MLQHVWMDHAGAAGPPRRHYVNVAVHEVPAPVVDPSIVARASRRAGENDSIDAFASHCVRTMPARCIPSSAPSRIASRSVFPSPLLTDPSMYSRVRAVDLRISSTASRPPLRLAEIPVRVRYRASARLVSLGAALLLAQRPIEQSNRRQTRRAPCKMRPVYWLFCVFRHVDVRM